MRFFIGNKSKRVLALLWLLATGLNLNKAFHIDDAFHLAAAQWIEQHPFTPMSGLVLWDYGYAPIHEYNQPPLYFYFIALCGHWWSYHEILLHLMQSGFTFLTIFFFYKLAQLVAPTFALLSTAFLVLNPAFLINQNVMVDVPLLSLHLIFIYLLLKPHFTSEWMRYVLVALVLSIALLIKYTSLPLLVILLAHLVLPKKFRFLAVLLLPIGVLLLWSIWNYQEFGAVHLFRPTSALTISRVSQKLLAFVITLGAITPFSLAYAAGFIAKYQKRYWFIIPTLIIMLLAFVSLTYQGFISEKNAVRALWGFCFINAICLIYLVLDNYWPFRNYKNLKKYSQSDHFTILLWGTAISSFIILFAHFMASRHVLLVLPAVILLAAKLLRDAPANLRILALVFSASISLLLAASDWTFADTYRQEAVKTKNKLKGPGTIWTVGYWGWHWYSQQAGMKTYVAGKVQVKKNDYFVIPANLPHQEFKNYTHLKLIYQKVVPRNKITFFSCSTIPGMYSTNYANPPIKLTRLPLDTIKIYQVMQAF
ncbi:ArnT family glycosyltransferase [Adhaeribacter pallidiroseus]|uniref:Uncharacterized protein n=1 Tax=Adhaeribacter pallidiroseus TaxID=2072847 RepID=A0A369QF86_9BACT|nr:glycosyltransferase family 39 protein [Adhaeribacter pallidiroseus]RDC63573.1 hypothetical protein AHMF7616_02178 [Adhaeribacter pallidiroseus]